MSTEILTQPHAIAITLTIPDNEARTAYSTLRRLGLNIGGLERADLYLLGCSADSAEIDSAVRRNEAMFNGNKHALSIRSGLMPKRGELWILADRPQTHYLGQLGVVLALTSWSITGIAGGPAPESTINEAAELLLCHPAVQRRIRHSNELPEGEYHSA